MLFAGDNDPNVDVWETLQFGIFRRRSGCTISRRANESSSTKEAANEGSTPVDIESRALNMLQISKS